MNTDLLKISLNQGKQFNNYQTKIKQNNTEVIKMKKNYKKNKLISEGFVSSPDESLKQNSDNSGIQNQTILSNDISNQQQLQKLLSLQDQYQKLIQQYNGIQKSISDSSLEVINRNSSSNSYLNKNILFTDGTICYVTSQGIAKPYSNSDIFKNNAGKNGCPNQDDIIKLPIPWLTSYVPGSIIPTSPTLIVGEKMTMNESCGFEGKNIYVSTLIDNPSSAFVGCYNDKPAITNINAIPIMNSSNNVNGFISNSSSTYLTNNDTYGAWAAFDQNPKTFWSSDESTTAKYNSNTGLYEGTNSFSVLNLGNISGESLGISMPGVATTVAQFITVTQYSLTPRADLFTTRSPNSWYILGYNNNNQWIQVDRIVGYQFNNSSPKVFTISNPVPYSCYLLLVDKVGNDDQTSNRSSVQVAEWNLYSNSLTNDVSSMTLDSNLIGKSSFDQCQQYAIDNNYQYFGSTDYQSNGLASCVVSNDISQIMMYGDATNQITAIPVWETNTIGSDTSSCYISSEGTLNLTNSSGTVTWTSPNGPQDCINGGNVNPNTIQGSFGGNCVGKPLNIDCGNPNPNQSYSADGIIGNLNDILKNKASSTTNANWIFNPISEWTGKDPAYCCSKNVDYSYQCGGGVFKTGEINSGSNINFDCSSAVSNCVFFLILQDDGNVCLNRGTDPSNNKGNIWCTMTNGKQKSKNPDWVSSKGKYGRNYLKNNEVLITGEWIGSNDGTMRLEMASNGNLVLYTSEIKSGCLKGNKGKIYGKKDINSVYKIDSVGNKNNLGKLAYIDSDSQLREYPLSMISYSNDYQLYQGYDSGGNDISTLQSNTIEDCKNACNNNSSCAAFVYQANTSTCWLKNNNAYPKGSKQINNGLQLGVRKPMLKGSSTCSNEIIDVDSIQYDNYSKGKNMTTKTICNKNTQTVSSENIADFDKIKNNLFNLGQQIVSEMEKLYNQDNKIYEKLNMNSEQFNKNLAMYKNINKKLQSNNNIEGMNNMDLNINDINGMLSDSDIRVLQENYSYIFWSILAVGILTVTINMMKK
jgi:hypothetical protein